MTSKSVITKRWRYYCDFCGKSDTEVNHMVMSGTPENCRCICNECIMLAHGIIFDALSKGETK